MLEEIKMIREAITQIIINNTVMGIQTIKNTNIFEKIPHSIKKDIKQSLCRNYHFDILQISLTNKCNLLCKHCSRSKSQIFNNSMSLSDFKIIIDKFDPKNFNSLLLSNFGESTLVPHFLNCLVYSKEKGWKNVEIVTNGTKSDFDFWESIISNQLLNRLLISIESANPQKYEFIRGQPYQRFYDFLLMLKNLKQKYSSPIKIAFNVTCMRYNLNDLINIVELAKEMKIHQIFFVSLNSLDYKEDSNKLCTSEQNLDSLSKSELLSVFMEVSKLSIKYSINVSYPEFFPEINKYEKEHRIHQFENIPLWNDPVSRKQIKDIRYKSSMCRMPFEWVQVSHSGEIFPCCQMGEKYSVGNILQSEFDEIWYGNKMSQLLDGLEKGNIPIEVCQNCNIIKGKNF